MTMEKCYLKMKSVVALLVVIFWSCTTEKPGEVATEVKTYEVAKSATVSDMKAADQNESTTASDDSAEAPGMEVSLKFDGLTITTRFEEIWNEEDYFDQIHADTILVQIGLGDDPSGKTYLIKTDSSIQSMEIFQNYETSLTLMNEGPHLDFTHWKHYISDWQKLNISDNQFNTLTYSQEDQVKFPDVTRDEIVQVVKQGSRDDSDGWLKLAEECKGANGYPCGVSISRINLKIVTTDINGVKKERLVIFEIPMGC